jgi:hypothetical protein
MKKAPHQLVNSEPCLKYAIVISAANKAKGFSPFAAAITKQESLMGRDGPKAIVYWCKVENYGFSAKWPVPYSRKIERSNYGVGVSENGKRQECTDDW